MNCPICNHTDNKNYCYKSGFELLKCLNCGLIFVYPIPEDLSVIYSSEYFNKKTNENKFGYTNYDQDKEPMRHVFNKYLKKFEKLVKNKRIFDVGAATGYFLDLAKENSWETAGIEISKYAVEEACARGHNVQLGDLNSITITKKFDIITMWDVLEHLSDPKKNLEAIHKILVPNGWLAINTIDKGSLWARFWGKNWHLIIPPEHLNYFSFKNLNILLQKTGFKPVEYKRIGKKFSLSYIFNLLYNWQGSQLWLKLSHFFDKPWWRKMAIPINFRDNIFILAKKQ